MYSLLSLRSVKGSKVGIPGSNDLETALRRLELRKQNIEAERKYHAEHPADSSEAGTPTCPTPDSFMSSLSGISTGGFHGGYRSFMPEKLQIVKPMEGESGRMLGSEVEKKFLILCSPLGGVSLKTNDVWF